MFAIRLVEIRTRAMVVQQKTGRPVQSELMADARTSPLNLGSKEGPLPTGVDESQRSTLPGHQPGQRTGIQRTILVGSLKNGQV
ncbi:MAG: hypothetical protein EOS18_21000 [Mesorhizobium sp.]|nr:MAG: hypothetical protein EOS18_21000 [Mesorhizobium sp.]